MIRGTNNQAYRELLLDFLPRPIAIEADYQATQQEIDHLLDKEVLTAEHINKLAVFFHLPHELFFEPLDTL